MKQVLVSLLSVLLLAPTWAATPEQDVDAFIARFNDTPSAQNRAVEDLAWKGVADTRLFDILAKRIEEGAPLGRSDGVQRDIIAHYIRALGYSGQSKYNGLLARMAADRSYERHAKISLEDLQSYQRWNPIISNRDNFNPAYSDDVNRVLNMLRSNDLVLNRIAGKRVYFATKDAVVLDALEARVRATYKLRGLSVPEADGIAWMVKGLGSTGEPKYSTLLKEVAASRDSEDVVVRHARRALDQYYK